MTNFKAVIENKVSRRKFISGVSAGLGATAAVSFAAGCSGSSTSTVPPAPTEPAYSDTDILNFALMLEYTEAEYWLRATTGAGLSAADAGTTPGNVTGGALVDFTMVPAASTVNVPVPGSVIQQYANELATIELAHVRFLRNALGSAAANRPEIDFTDGFAAAAKAAGIQGTFNAFSDPYALILGAYVFADVGVTALHGAATLIKDKVNVLPAAAGLLGTESYQAAEFRTILTYLGMNYVNYADQISALRANAGGGAETALKPDGSAIVAADSNSIAYDRTTDQVLHILYLNPNPGVVSSGGFFPAGLNGNIKASVS